MKTQLIWTGGFLHTADHTVLLRATGLVEDQLVSVYSCSQQHEGYREASKTLLAMVFPMSTTPSGLLTEQCQQEAFSLQLAPSDFQANKSPLAPAANSSVPP